MYQNECKMVYLDYNATTPVSDEVLEAMLPYFTEYFGNSSSTTHEFGWKAQAGVEKARAQVANFIGAEASEITFTSGATEAINMAIKGIFRAYQTKGKHIITCQTEHKAVLDVCAYLEEYEGAKISYLAVDREGRIDLDDLKNAFTPETILVAIMAANNETGVIQDLENISAITHQHEAIFFSDTTQMAGKLSLDVNELGIDACCISGHKLYAPKGVGALYLRRKNPRVSIIPLIHGGGHENGKRSGSLNVPGIVALGKACELAAKNYWDLSTEVSKLRAYLEHQLLEIPDLRINGSTRYRLYNTSNLYFPPLKDGSSLFSVIKLKYAVSLGSACNSANNEASHVLTAMRITSEDAKHCIRFSFGKNSQKEDVEKLCEFILSQY